MNDKRCNTKQNNLQNFYTFAYPTSVFLLKSNDDFKVDEKNISYLKLANEGASS
jgi:hypothetical protein